MASYEETLVNVTLDAHADIAVDTRHMTPRNTAAVPANASAAAGYQYRFVRVSGPHQCNLYTATAGQIPVGVLQNKPQVPDHAATVAIFGISLVEASGAIAAGSLVGSDVDGRAAAVGAGDPALGIAIHAADAAGQLIPVLLRLTTAAAA